jgi:hypothetical protein
MATYTDFQNEVLDAIAGVTGLVKAGGASQTLFTSVEAAQISVIEYINDSDSEGKRPMPPYGAVQIGQDTHDPEWGVRSRTRRAPVAFALLDTYANGATQESVREMLEAVADALDFGSFTTFQSPPELAEIDASDGNTVFMALGADAKGEIVAGIVRWEPGLLIER